MSGTGVLLAAHGASEPGARAQVEQIAARLRARGAADRVATGFHLGGTGFTEALDRLEADRVLILPLFTSEGYYTEEVLPRAVAASARAAQTTIRQAPPIGAERELMALVAARARRVIAAEGLDPERLAVLVVGHGTRRNVRSRDTTRHLVALLRTEVPALEVVAAFLDDDPELEPVLAALTATQLLVIPFLVGGGGHALADLPRRLGASEGNETRRVVLDIPVGAYEELADLLCTIVRRELPPVAAANAWEPGSVTLVGAGPGDPGLITVRGLARLRAADVVLHDRLAAPELLREVRRDAVVVDVGKRAGGTGIGQEGINRLLVEHARAGRRVVRLKGGDPFVFGRGAEEMDACLAAGVPCTVVPGVSSAIAAPAAAGIPVTARGESRAFAVITAQGEDGELPASVHQLAAHPGIETLVLLMGLGVLPELTAALIAAGRDPETPAACIQSGTTERQRVVAGTLASIARQAEEEGLQAPVVTVVGVVAARARVAVSC